MLNYVKSTEVFAINVIMSAVKICFCRNEEIRHTCIDKAKGKNMKIKTVHIPWGQVTRRKKGLKCFFRVL